MFAIQRIARAPVVSLNHVRMMGTIVDGVSFNNVAREWRMKWNADNDKKSLADIQKTVNSHIAEIKAIEGVKSVQRVVCGGCLDYKLVVTLDHGSFGKWATNKFQPEEAILAKFGKIPGVTQIETQTYTLEQL